MKEIQYMRGYCEYQYIVVYNNYFVAGKEKWDYWRCYCPKKYINLIAAISLEILHQQPIGDKLF